MLKGLAIHCHHDILLEYCYDYDKRITAIKHDKPAHEQEIRLRLFKLLPQEAIDELPERLVKAFAERIKADAEWKRAFAEWKKAFAEWKKASAEWDRADAERIKANAEREKADQEIWHKKWCGCKFWKNGSIDFTEKVKEE